MSFALRRPPTNQSLHPLLQSLEGSSCFYCNKKKTLLVEHMLAEALDQHCGIQLVTKLSLDKVIFEK
ncbi:hypothetical protein TSUD_44090 [Trifolium subterraneum]|uniref:Uncharacterized protein n=1 Tax=Trifolium subterraneum TaxID=3900 RepID=A0A2Z6MI83_TRISU|nr:hypothetical protein TSUD_44090 [Trifolium subterraneum]